MQARGGGRDPRARVWACIVCHHPDAASLRALIGALAPQAERVLVMDNTPGGHAPPQGLPATAQYVRMPRNAGTAGAMNEAWRLALDGGADYLVSFDQDSLPEAHLVQCLLRSFDADVAPLAAAGPSWIDARTGRAMRLLQPVRLVRHHIPAPERGLAEVDHMISSGCLIAAQAWRDVGPYNESLFLDYVDVEWSLRARAKGWRLAVASGCRMTHAIGERMIEVAGRQLAVHSPPRSYLQMRNHLLLWRSTAIPRGWLLSDLKQTLGKLALLLVLAPRRFERLRWIARGVLDGLRGRGGGFPG
jgi:rhamnosyltransferase